MKVRESLRIMGRSINNFLTVANFGELCIVFVFGTVTVFIAPELAPVYGVNINLFYIFAAIFLLSCLVTFFEYLRGRGKPRIIGPTLFMPSVELVVRDGRLTVTCPESYIYPLYAWYKDSKVLPNNSGPSLIIEEPGEYKVYHLDNRGEVFEASTKIIIKTLI